MLSALATGCSGNVSEQSEQGGAAGAGAGGGRASGGGCVGGSGVGGVGGGGVSGGGSASLVGGGSGCGAPHPELCGLSASCSNGVLRVRYGYFCIEYSRACECSGNPDLVSSYLGGDPAILSQYLRDAALCLEGDGAGGEVGDDEGRAGGTRVDGGGAL